MTHDPLDSAPTDLHAGDGLCAVRSPHNELPEQRVVVGGHKIVGVHVAVHANLEGRAG